jgi:predicted nucleic acid-binding protein
LGGKTAGGTLKPKVYIETSVISYLTARPSNDLRAMANQNATVEWWETQRSKYDLVISEFVIAEAGLGHPEAAKRRLAAVDDVMELQATEEVRALGKALINLGALPAKAEVDAYHVAVAAVNGVEYLLTWNCTHIANARTRPKIEAACRSLGYEPPIICTPDELTEN